MGTRISEHRKKIDELDAKILELIQKRIDETISIRRLKIEEGIPLFTPEREQELIQRLIEKSNNNLATEVVEDIWKTIIKGGKRTKDNH
ncbi:chorismate mutase [bacterium]|nr:chorismate mutase [bacterium]